MFANGCGRRGSHGHLCEHQALGHRHPRPPWAGGIAAALAIGLAAAVLLDAFLLRTLLVPALIHVAGRANWWLPGWLDRILPHLSIEPATERPAPPSPAPASQVAHRTAAQ